MPRLMRVVRRAVVAAAAVGTTMSVVIGPAAALAEPQDPVQTAAAVVTAVQATPAASADAGAVPIAASASDIGVPRDPQHGVVVDGANGGPGVTLGLPVDSLTNDAVVVADTVVYTQPDGHSNVAVQPLSDGSLRAAVSIADAGARTDYSYTLGLPDDVTPVLNEAGGIDLVRAIASFGNSGDVAQIVVGGLQAPWASDANGNSIPTRYTIDGDTVTQHVEFGADSAFPIVADPHLVMHWYGPGLKFSRTETGRIRSRAVAAALFAAICAFTGPATLGITCGVSGAELGAAAAVASNAYGDHKCLELLWGFVPRPQGC